MVGNIGIDYYKEFCNTSMTTFLLNKIQIIRDRFFFALSPGRAVGIKETKKKKKTFALKHVIPNLLIFYEIRKDFVRLLSISLKQIIGS